MGAAWFWFRATAARRARSCLAVVLLLTLLGGLTLASLSGARRTASAYPRFRQAGRAVTLHVNAGDVDHDWIERITALPGVTGSASYAAFVASPLAAGGGIDGEFPTFEAAGSVDGLFFERDRFAPIRGRMPDPSRAGETAVNEHLAEAAGIRLGDRFDLGIFAPADEEAIYGDDAPPPAARVPVTVVGIGLFPDEVVQDDTDRIGRMLLTPAFTRLVRAHVTYVWTGIGLAGDQRAAPEFEREARRLLPDGRAAFFRERADVVDQTQKAMRPIAVALAIFGGLAGLATVVLVGQAVVRLLRADRRDLAVLRALGAGPRTTSTLGLPAASVSLVAGVVGAVAVALALSPLAPIGPVRRVEPDAGVSADWTVLGCGAASLLTVLGVVAVAVAVRQAPHRRWAEDRPRRPGSVLLRGAARAALPAPVHLGLRMAAEPGEGGSPATVRATSGGAIVAVLVLTAAIVFGASLRALGDWPRLYGWDWDLTVLDESGYGNIDVDRTGRLLDHDPDVEAWSGAHFGSVTMDGSSVPALGMAPDEPVTPPLVAGRFMKAVDEVVLGTTTLDRLGKDVGDTVALGDGGGTLRIVGRAVLPTVGPVFGDYTSLGLGVVLHHERIPGWDFADPGTDPGPKVLFIRLREGADRPAAMARLSGQVGEVGRFPGTAAPLPVQRPAEIVHSRSVGSTPAVLAGGLALAALASLGLSLAAGVARRRRDLSVLKCLGFTRGQLSAAVVCQSLVIAGAGLLVGGLMGVALGRWLWVAFAQQLPVLAEPSVPGPAIAAVAAGMLGVAAVVAWAPARAAGRTAVAAGLRTE